MVLGISFVRLVSQLRRSNWEYLDLDVLEALIAT